MGGVRGLGLAVFERGAVGGSSTSHQKNGGRVPSGFGQYLRPALLKIQCALVV